MFTENILFQSLFIYLGLNIFWYILLWWRYQGDTSDHNISHPDTSDDNTHLDDDTHPDTNVDDTHPPDTNIDSTHPPRYKHWWHSPTPIQTLTALTHPYTNIDGTHQHQFQWWRSWQPDRWSCRYRYIEWQARRRWCVSQLTEWKDLLDSQMLAWQLWKHSISQRWKEVEFNVINL